ncbi:MAG: rhodanese-like domain-containing protein [Candidatus Electrothrix sp. AR3]|nr:rhodanese-like domain-containing protein [Candidatus Electrothrix sp. AR3]
MYDTKGITMKRTLALCYVILTFSLILPAFSFSADLKGETAVFNELRSVIPKDKIKNVDDLYGKWKEIQGDKSEAIIIDVRTEAEFDAGHIINSSNVDSGHAYGLRKKIEDASSEIWIICRTQHRASYFVGLLYKYGYTNVYLAEGGIKGWAEKGYPLINKYLGVINVTKYQNQAEEDFLFRENK